MNQNAIKALTEKLGRPTEAEGGPAPEVKPGTRCECRVDHNYHNGPLSQHENRACGFDAVRLVTVAHFRESDGQTFIDEGHISMCAACANHAEVTK
jgi:hypothetical protein